MINVLAELYYYHYNTFFGAAQVPICKITQRHIFSTILLAINYPPMDPS